MVSQPKDAAYRHSAELLLKLHALMRDGRGETEEADKIREASEGPWWQMTEEEKQRLRYLSADLTTLEPDSDAHHPESGGILSDGARRELDALLLRVDWEAVLQYLRDHSDQVAADFAAYYRGRCWDELGEHEAAIEFLRFASAKSDVYAFSLISPLLSADRVGEAMSLCERLADSLETVRNPYGVFAVANGCCSIAGRVDDEHRPVWLERALRVFQEGFGRISTLREQGYELEVTSANYASMALCHQLLGNAEEALRTSQTALSLDPNNSLAKVLHGLILNQWNGVEPAGEGSREIVSGMLGGLSAQMHFPPLEPDLLQPA